MFCQDRYSASGVGKSQIVGALGVSELRRGAWGLNADRVAMSKVVEVT
jgi:phenylalanyl-tRNA synthetase alpha subunit